MVAVVVFGAAIFFSRQSPDLPTGGKAIVDVSTYQAERSRMGDLAIPRVNAFEKGLPLTPDDLNKVREASGILDGMLEFDPTVSGNYFLSGKVHTILGEESIAIERYRQCIDISVKDATLHPETAAIIKANAAQANYEISVLLLMHNDKPGAFAAADAAVREFPETPNYLIARASALNELRRIPEAKQDLRHVLKIDPANTRAAGLLKFISK